MFWGHLLSGSWFLNNMKHSYLEVVSVILILLKNNKRKCLKLTCKVFPCTRLILLQASEVGRVDVSITILQMGYPPESV